MESEKIYYGAIVLISAVSVLISPFFYVRRGRRAATAGGASWLKILAANILTAAVLLAVWWFWLRKYL